MPIPVISIITPAKNRLMLLRETIASVQAQTLPNWEHLIIDDGSDDGSQEMVEQWAATDPRVRLIRRQGDKVGANVCRNIGIQASRSEFLVFLDSDDLLAPDCLSGRLKVMQRNEDLEFAVWQTSVFEKFPGDLGMEFSRDPFGDDLMKFLFLDFPWQTTAPVWRKNALLDLGGWDETLPSWQDVDLHIRAICRGMKYVRFRTADNHMRWEEDAKRTSNLQRTSPEHLKAALPTLEKFEQAVRSGPGLDWARQRALCSPYFFVAERWVDLGSLREALTAWKCVLSKALMPRSTHIIGTTLLCLKSASKSSEFVRRLIGKWIGIARMRNNPRLLK